MAPAPIYIGLMSGTSLDGVDGVVATIASQWANARFGACRHPVHS